MNLLIAALFLGSMTITSYRSVPNQTDSSPWVTSNGERVHPHGVAVSRDLLQRYGGPLSYGDVLYIEGFGFKVVNDVMHQRHKRSIDVWVATYAEEKRAGVAKGRVWVIHPVLSEEICETKRTERFSSSAKRAVKRLVTFLRVMLRSVWSAI